MVGQSYGKGTQFLYEEGLLMKKKIENGIASEHAHCLCNSSVNKNKSESKM